jgi:homocitrate synthase NifV
MPKKDNRIYIIDVTNRDGVQTSRLGLAKLQKTIINVLLNEMGVYQSEFGFPVTHHEKHYLNANLKLAKMGVLKPIILSGWTRAIVSDIKQALELTNVEHLNISASTSTQMIRGKYRGKRSGDDVIKDMTNALGYAKTHGIKTVGVNAEDASRTELEYLIKFASAAKDNGADRFRYCDTLGYDDPLTIYNRIKAVAQKVRIPIELHCHNDLGMVVANSVAGAKAAIDAGVNAYINTSVNGMGERAGNADLVSVILAIQKSSGFEERTMLDERVDLSKSWQIATYASYAFGVDIPINQPGVGANAFAHESGIHADGALKDRHNYELYDYQELGLGEPEVIDTGRKITAGEYSGIKGFRNVYEKLEIRFHDDEEATKILELVRYANVHTQRPLVKKELLFIARYPDIAKEIMTFTPLE